MEELEAQRVNSIHVDPKRASAIQLLTTIGKRTLVSVPAAGVRYSLLRTQLISP